MLPTGGNQAPGTCRNASRSLAWLEARRPRRGRLCHSLDGPTGPTVHLEMMVMLVVGKPNGRSNGKADAGDTQLQCQAALREWMWPTLLMTRRARACRATTSSLVHCLIETQFSHSSNGCFDRNSLQLFKQTFKHMSARHLWSQQTLRKVLFRAQRDRHKHETRATCTRSTRAPQ